MHLFVILQFYTILCILICFKAPRKFLDLALYQIKYIIIIIIIRQSVLCAREASPTVSPSLPALTEVGLSLHL